MRYYRLVDPAGEKRLAVEVGSDGVADLTSLDPALGDLPALAQAAHLGGVDMDAFTGSLLRDKTPTTHSLRALMNASSHASAELRLARPIDPPEVWAAGVTYKTSEMERRRESQTPDVYASVYSAARPEIFFKATAHRCVGPFEPVGIRTDSAWNVPEPELALVLYGGVIVGYTAGNDMTSRAIEGENPLYLPQAKVYDRCCAIGPCIATVNAIPDPHSLTIRCAISRGGKEIFQGRTSTSQMARRCDHLVEWLTRHNPVPDFSVLLTGTAIVPPPDFTLEPGDVVSISIEGIGVLENEVVAV